MSKIGWSFDINTLNNYGRGADAGITAMQQYSNVDYLVRETLQNCYDQKSGEGTPVRVVFSVYRLDGDSREKFLSSVGWYDLLRSRIEDVVERSAAPKEERDGFSRVLEETDNGEPLWLLKISDYGTRGLQGGDDQSGENFNLLCKSEINTPSKSQNRGGNTGIGKSMYWMYSSWRTVFFSSRVPTDSAHETRVTTDLPTCKEGEIDPLRIFARTAFPSFWSSEGIDYFGPGFFGYLVASEKLPGYERALSVWSEDAETIGPPLKLQRDLEDGPGTSILIVGLRHPAETESGSEQMGLNSWITDIKNAAGRWFWPAISNDQIPLKVIVEGYDGDDLIASEAVETPYDAKPFSEIHRISKLGEATITESGIVKEELDFQIPARRANPDDPVYPDGHEATSAKFTLLIRTAEPGSDSGKENQVAYMRGTSGFVLDYKIKRIGGSASPYHAVLLGGQARGDTEEDKRLERFLWRSEPLGHDKWDARRPELRGLYRDGSVTAFNNLERSINNRLRRFVEGDPEPLPPGTSRLGRLFRLRGQGGPPPGRPRFNWGMSKVSKGSGGWEFSGWVTGPKAEGTRWKFELSLWADAENGKGTYIPIDHLDVSSGVAEKVTRIVSGEEVETEWRCLSPNDCQRVNFKGATVKISDPALQLDLERSRLRIDLRQSVLEESNGE